MLHSRRKREQRTAPLICLTLQLCLRPLRRPSFTGVPGQHSWAHYRNIANAAAPNSRLDYPAWSHASLSAATSCWMITTSRWTASPILPGVCNLASSASDPGARGPRLPGVVGAAPGALLPQHVEPHARGRAAVVAQDPYLRPQRSFVVQLRQSAPGHVQARQTTMHYKRPWKTMLRDGEYSESGRSASYHLLLVDVRHWRRRNLLIELPPRGGHVAGGPRAHRAREAAKDQTRLRDHRD